jgi:membrane protease subunit HflC
MSKTIKFVLGITFAVVIFLTINSLFIVRQTEQAIVLQFGKMVKIVKEPGLNYKLPFVQNVVFYDNRLLELDPEAQEILLIDKKRISVDSFTRFKIVDPLKFYQTQRTVFIAIPKLGDNVNSSVREVLGNVTLPTLLSGEKITLEDGRVISERQKIMQDIKKSVSKYAQTMGVEIADVRIKRADLPVDVAQAINARMRSEREREAQEFRAEGRQLAQEIRAKADREYKETVAEARKTAQIIKGKGEEIATNTWANAANKDKEFYGFYRGLEAYRKALKNNDTSMVLSPDSEFFKYFGKLPRSRK